MMPEQRLLGSGRHPLPPYARINGRQIYLNASLTRLLKAENVTVIWQIDRPRLILVPGGGAVLNVRKFGCEGRISAGPLIETLGLADGTRLSYVGQIDYRGALGFALEARI